MEQKYWYGLHLAFPPCRNVQIEAFSVHLGVPTRMKRAKELLQILADHPAYPLPSGRGKRRKSLVRVQKGKYVYILA